MTDQKPAPQNILSLQNQDPSKQPVELYHLSHDLRGPLNSMLGFADLLIEGIEGPLNDIQIEDITAIRQSARNLLHLINTIVDLSKLDAGRIALSPVPLDLAHMIDEITTYEIKIERVEFAASFANTLPPVSADQSRLKQMCLNLLTFAAKAQKEGTITVSYAHNSESVTAQIGAGGATFSPEQADSLFNLQVRSDSAGRSELGKGGVELPLVRGLAQQHGGNAWARSMPGAGTAFYLTLPVAQTE